MLPHPRPRSTVTRLTLPLPNWQTLSFEAMAPYEPIAHQYDPLGITIQDGIVVWPSNPQFILGDRRPVLLPSQGPHRGLTLTLQQTLETLQLWVMGSQPITVIALDGDGHCLTCGHTRDLSPTAQSAPLGQQMVQLQGHGVARIHLSSPAPFVVNQVRVQRHQQAIPTAIGQ